MTMTDLVLLSMDYYRGAHWRVCISNETSQPLIMSTTSIQNSLASVPSLGEMKISTLSSKCPNNKPRYDSYYQSPPWRTNEFIRPAYREVGEGLWTGEWMTLKWSQ